MADYAISFVKYAVMIPVGIAVFLFCLLAALRLIRIVCNKLSWLNKGDGK